MLCGSVVAGSVEGGYMAGGTLSAALHLPAVTGRSARGRPRKQEARPPPTGNDGSFRTIGLVSERQLMEDLWDSRSPLLAKTQVFLCSCPSARSLAHPSFSTRPARFLSRRNRDAEIQRCRRGVVFLIIASVIPRCVARFRLRM